LHIVLGNLAGCLKQLHTVSISGYRLELHIALGNLVRR